MTNRLPPERKPLKSALAARLSEVRRELYGELGGPELASVLGLPHRTWAEYEGGATIPGEILLAFIEATRVEPLWLLRGVGPAYRGR